MIRLNYLMAFCPGVRPWGWRLLCGNADVSLLS